MEWKMIVGFEENDISKNANGGTEITKRKLAAEIDQSLLEHFQIIPSRVRGLQNDKIRIYWAHDLIGDPETKFFEQPKELEKFHKIVFSSNWQYQQYMNFYQLPYNSKSVVIDTWMDPAPADVITNKPKDKIDIFYASTPQRGLEVLIPVFEKLTAEHSNLHLHVHSSFKIYGWDEMDEKYKPLYDKIKNNPNMTYHGYTERTEILKAMNNYHILAFPSTWPETSCRVLMEAMTAGCLCVHPNFGALPDTSGGLTWMFPGDLTDINRHAQNCYETLKIAVSRFESKPESFPDLEFIKQYADRRFSFEVIKQKWVNLLEALKEQYGSPESRETKVNDTPDFVYRI